MADTTILQIGKANVPDRSNRREACWNEHRGGSAVLLRWLETQLGLLSVASSRANRVTQYAAGLEKVTDACFTQSLSNDPWGTSCNLLAKRDELCLAGWDAKDSSELPPLVRDLARVGKDRTLSFPGEAERLQAVLGALNDGQKLPPHRCVLFDPIARWPHLWQKVLKWLNVEAAPVQPPSAAETTSLGRIQRGLRSGEVLRGAFDPSLRWIGSRSTFAACEAITAALAVDPDRLSRTTVCCESDTAAVCLDACLARAGLPTMGASVQSLAHPALQVLPLVLALCWEPVDPDLLLDFLSLPIGPIPRFAAARLSAALAEQPGLGSGSWEEAMDGLCSSEHDPKQDLSEKLQVWLEPPRVARGGRLPTELVRERCGKVSQWAAGQAAWLEEEGGSKTLRATLLLAAAQSSALGELAQTQADDITEPQLARLREAASATRAESVPFPEAFGGPQLVKSLSEIHAETDDLIWLGLGTLESQTPRWTAYEFQQLSEQGIDLDDGTHALAALRDAERRGISRIRHRILAVSLPEDEERTAHPVWLQVLGVLPLGQRPLNLEELLSGEFDPEVTAPWQFATANTTVEPPQPPRPEWKLTPGLLEDRDSSSATELGDRLACPLKWVFNYAAKLKPSPIARLPSSFQLKGTFCHSVLSQVFGIDKPLPTEDEADRRVAETFDARLPLDAAPLAQPHCLTERQKLREELLNATRTLVRSLKAGGYRRVSLETPILADLDGRRLGGSIDCLAVRDDQSEAVIDFKYSGTSKYSKFLKEGRAIQLATYCYARTFQRGGDFPVAAYLVLSDGLLHTPAGSPLAGVEVTAIVRNGPAIADVWRDFIAAIHHSEDWLNGQEPVPARPLQNPGQWPKGVEIVLIDPASVSKSNQQSVCQYCNYQALCGLKELS